MVTYGQYNIEDKKYDVILYHNREESEVILLVSGMVYSSYKTCLDGNFLYGNNKSKELWAIINNGLKACTSKNGVAAPFVRGTVSRHTFKRSNINYIIDRYNGELAGLEVTGDNLYCHLEYCENESIRIKNIPYIKLTDISNEFNNDIKEEDTIVVKRLEEIKLYKEDNLRWLDSKKYYIINDNATAEKIFSYLENYKGPISFDTETTGTRINMFGKVNSEWQKKLEEYNLTRGESKPEIRSDKLVGFIFSIEPNVAYYFPVFNRKFKNLYEDVNDPIRKQVIRRIKQDKMKFDPKCLTDMGRLLRDTEEEKLTPDVIAMERIRAILENGHIVAHNGAFEWKVCWMYEIDVNLRDDTMILHQLLYKFRSTTSNRGESSTLKNLEKVEFGIDSLELKDFFPELDEDSINIVRGRKKSKNKRRIDFSYMDYDGARAYAPADGDWTLQLYFKYKRDLIENHKEMEYIYNVEVIVACAIGYMEFYGHTIDESKIEDVKQKTRDKCKELEVKIRALAGLTDTEELNLASPLQVAQLFFERLGIPLPHGVDSPSVSKSVLIPLIQMKNDDGSDKYPIINFYFKWKKLDTLLTKFFDNLQDYMYPGGYIFSSYGQISTATGRMSCSKPNAQQYPKDVTEIVVPRPGYIMLDCDYSQIEYRVLVAMAMEKGLLERFNDPDMDYHTMMASLMYNVPYASVTPKMRSDAKSFNFGIPYGMGFKSLAILLTGKTGPAQIEEAKVKYELYFKDQPNVRKFFDQVKEMALINRYTKTYWNRYRYYSFKDKDGNTSNALKAAALRQAGNAVIQGSAADIFKISIARNFIYIRKWKLLGHILITNMVHDELLFEVNYKTLNTQRVLKDIADNMQFSVDGFPILYIGAGFGLNWKSAKGKKAEIHPFLCNQLSKEVENVSVYAAQRIELNDIMDYYNKRVYEFRKNKIINYLLDVNNKGKDLHPVIGNLLNLDFTYGLEDIYSGDELTFKCLEKFIEDNNLCVKASDFKLNSEQIIEDNDDGDYNDEDEQYSDYDINDNDFTLIDESESIYGVSLQDIIGVFGLVISQERRVCGIDVRRISVKLKDKLVDYIYEHKCEPNEEGSMQVVFLKENNVLFETGVWVKGISGSEISGRLKSNTLSYR